MNLADDQKLNHNLEIAYRLLAACLYQPTATWADEGIFGHLKKALEIVAPEAVTGAETMERTFTAVGETEIAVTHARLFVGPFSLGAPPYGSFYLEPEKKVMGDSTLAVLEFYRQAGLSLEEDFPELPDHMAVELEFLSFLLQRVLSSREAVEAAQWVDRRREFLRRFVTGWFVPFSTAIRGATDDPFYRGYADCLLAVVRRDTELLGLS